ncbi:hypothetical protein ACFSM5_12410 [Lacibacterium aquatile]|uniref:Uncharacterized protein n=1 Tax=Lacibacterium aquatile TaxID=1168082 RepID=A0ABW5DTD1_9PROT
MRFLGLLILALGAVAAPAGATSIYYVKSLCETFYGGEANFPLEAQVNLRQGGRLESCHYPELTPPRTTYEYSSEPALGWQGVCAFTSRHWDPARRDEAPYTRSYMALPKAGICPRLGDTDYVHVQHVSEGVFLAVHQLVAKLQTRPDARAIFVHTLPDHIFAKFPNAETMRLLLREKPDVAWQHENHWLQSLTAPKLERVEFVEARGLLPSHYEIKIRDSGTLWGLSIDFIDGQLKALARSEPEPR